MLLTAFGMIIRYFWPETSMDLLFVMFMLIAIPSFMAVYYRFELKGLQRPKSDLGRKRDIG